MTISVTKLIKSNCYCCNNEDTHALISQIAMLGSLLSNQLTLKKRMFEKDI